MTQVRVAFEATYPGSVDKVAAAFYQDFDGVVTERAGQIGVAVYLDLDSAAYGVRQTIESLEDLGLCIVRVDRDLVDAPEIASRLGVTRQAVNLWAKGTRGSAFPHPIGSPGGKRIWTWGQITEWAAREDRLDEPRSLTLDEAVEIDSFLVRRRESVIRASGVRVGPLVAPGTSKSNLGPAGGFGDYTESRSPIGSWDEALA
jgi:hypothetical protein